MTETHFGSTLPGFNSLDNMFGTILSLRKKFGTEILHVRRREKGGLLCHANPLKAYIFLTESWGIIVVVCSCSVSCIFRRPLNGPLSRSDLKGRTSDSSARASFRGKPHRTANILPAAALIYYSQNYFCFEIESLHNIVSPWHSVWHIQVCHWNLTDVNTICMRSNLVVTYS